VCSIISLVRADNTKRFSSLNDANVTITLVIPPGEHCKN
jgi:hypothetical protein